MKKKKRNKFKKTAIFAAAATAALVTPAIVAPIDAEAVSRWVYVLQADYNIVMKIDGEKVTGQWGGRTLRLVSTKDDNVYYTRTLPRALSVKDTGTYYIYDLTDYDLTDSAQAANVHKMLKPAGKITIHHNGRLASIATLNYNTVTFYGNSEKSEILATSLVLSGDKVKEPSKPTSEGKTFIEWVDKDGKRFDFSTQPITSKTEVFAKWCVPTSTTVPTEPKVDETMTVPTEPKVDETMTVPTEPKVDETMTVPTEPKVDETMTVPTEPKV
ncbi:InlB B-repeat-containing protein, partial [Lysinibacillus sp. NPDC097162]|uniref:InlB B-repeat-containing protein n=1 Tax=Lysinibacillus sp. NPDC097162 TaxID=3364140 RepID=UPI00380D041A